MPTVTVSSKHQITLPAQIVRELGLHGGDKLTVELIDKRIVAVPQPASWADYVRGSAHGVYGRTTQEIHRHVAEERASWDTTDASAGADVEAFVDYYVAQEGTPVRRLIQVLAESPWPGALTADGIAQKTKASYQQVEELVHTELGPRGWVKRIAVAEGRTRYRLRSDLAAEVRKTSAP